MSFRDWIPPVLAKRFFPAPLAQKANPAGPLIVSSYGLNQAVRTPRRFDTLADQGYNQQAPVFRGINLIATACAGIPWRLYEKKGSNRRGSEVMQAPLLDRLAAPNDTQGWGKFFEAYVSYLYIAGNSYLWANRSSKGQPLELWVLRPDRVRVIPDKKQFVSGYSYEVGGAHIEFSTKETLHTKTFAPLDDWYGMSPLVVAARSVDILNAGGDWNLALTQNSGRMPGFFTMKERMGDEQFSRLREQLLERYTGSRNVGLPGLLDGGDIGWLPNGISPLDMDWSKLTIHEQRMISLCMGVPSEMMADPEVKTYASYAEARAGFYTETVLPLMDILRDELNRWIVPMYGDSRLWLDYDTEDIEALAPLREKRWNQVNSATFLMIDEKREAVGYDPLPDGMGKVVIVPVNNTTLDEIVNGVANMLGMQANQPRALQPGSTQPPNDNSGPGDNSDSDAPAQPGDKPGDTGVADNDVGQAGVDGGAKRRDPIDDLLAGKIIYLSKFKRRRKDEGDFIAITHLMWDCNVEACPTCLENDGAIVEADEYGDAIEAFPNGWYSPDDAHPHCDCTVYQLNVPDDQVGQLGRLGVGAIVLTFMVGALTSRRQQEQQDAQQAIPDVDDDEEEAS